MIFLFFWLSGLMKDTWNRQIGKLEPRVNEQGYGPYPKKSMELNGFLFFMKCLLYFLFLIYF